MSTVVLADMVLVEFSLVVELAVSVFPAGDGLLNAPYFQAAMPATATIKTMMTAVVVFMAYIITFFQASFHTNIFLRRK